MEDRNYCVRKRDRHIRLTRKNVGRSYTAHVQQPFFLVRSWMRQRFFHYTGLQLVSAVPCRAPVLRSSRALQLRREAQMVSPAMGATIIGTMYFLRANCAQHGGSASGGGLISASLLKLQGSTLVQSPSRRESRTSDWLRQNCGKALGALTCSHTAL